MQKVIFDRPPLWAEIDAMFKVAGKNVIFSWGPNAIYNPQGVKISRELMAHEEVHGARQGKTDEEIFAWWRRYLKEPMFRFEEELPAHRAEYQAFCKRHGSSLARMTYLGAIAKRLSSDLYGNIVTYSQAREKILFVKERPLGERLRAMGFAPVPNPILR